MVAPLSQRLERLLRSRSLLERTVPLFCERCELKLTTRVGVPTATATAATCPWQRRWRHVRREWRCCLTAAAVLANNALTYDALAFRNALA